MHVPPVVAGWVVRVEGGMGGGGGGSGGPWELNGIGRSGARGPMVEAKLGGREQLHGQHDAGYPSWVINFYVVQMLHQAWHSCHPLTIYTGI